MLTAERSDIVILGAGLAGLTLACKLISGSATATLTLIGPQDSRNQRISFWTDAQARQPYTPFLSHSWQRWTFHHPRWAVVSQQARSRRYVSLDARRYKAYLQDQLDPRRCQLIQAPVTGLQLDAQGCNIRMDTGMIRAATVIDTRPPRIPETTLKQQFWGATLDLARPHGIGEPVLMDFAVTPVARDGVTFVYVLPLSATQLLVEATTFSTHLHPASAYRDCVKQWVEDNLGSDVTLDNALIEMGTLPMGPVLPLAPTLPNCGLAGGAARASTGYAFTGTERQTGRMVSQLLSGAPVRTQSPFSARANWMDRVFLQVAKHQPEQLVTLFMAMAQRLSGDDFADFLSDTGGWLPCWRTICAAPKWPFITAAASTWRRR